MEKKSVGENQSKKVLYGIFFVIFDLSNDSDDELEY